MLSNNIEPTKKDLEREVERLEEEVLAARELMLALFARTDITDGRLKKRIADFQPSHALELAKAIGVA